MHIIFHDGTGRYIISFTTGRDGTFFFAMARDGTFISVFRDGTVGIFFHCTGERMQNTLLSAPRQQCYKLKLYVVSYHTVSYDIIRALSMGTY